MLEAWAVPVCGSLLAVEMLSRILGCKTAATARNATLLGAAIYLSVGLIPVTIGLAGPTLVPGLEEPEQLVALLAQQHLSTFLYVLVRRRADLGDPLHRRQLLARGRARSSRTTSIVPLKPRLTERQKITTARIGVAVFGVAAYVIALYAGGIYELVATASAFGSAGIFVVGMFGLFSRVGGAASAYAALVAGVVVWAAGEYWLEWSTPYVIALAAALAAYLAAAVLVRRAPARRPAVPTRLLS